MGSGFDRQRHHHFLNTSPEFLLHSQLFRKSCVDLQNRRITQSAKSIIYIGVIVTCQRADLIPSLTNDRKETLRNGNLYDGKRLKTWKICMVYTGDFDMIQAKTLKCPDALLYEYQACAVNDGTAQA
jgi:hypothetical protein